MKIETLQSSTAFADHSKNIDFHVFLGSNTEMHRHADYYEIFYVTKGTVAYTINNTHLALKQGDLTIVRPCDTHAFLNSSKDGVQHVNLAIKQDYFYSITGVIDLAFAEKLNSLSMPPIVKLDDFEYRELEHWKRKINTSKNSSSSQIATNLSTLVFICLSYINNHLQYTNDQYPSWFNNLLDVINSSAFVNKSVQDIYTSCNFSPPIIIKMFKKHLGQTPIQYLTEVKINYACNLLQNTDYSILYISNKLGYDSLSHFNRIFKNNKKLTPSQYRTQAKTQKTD